ncbi:hypothetical protein AVEN_113305-1 [Araneus ventricosus]|uniref:Uncharacterized protein n=1 Tax=Araneus ventricosus TaxID=182803 RepID=A0A4Y2GPU0_ARAVE|nr:hypothetical protein AVEN_113305-1 [Araneus ventricosus]
MESLKRMSKCRANKVKVFIINADSDSEKEATDTGWTISNHKRMDYSAQSRHADNLYDPATATINRALWPSRAAHYERLMRRLLRQRDDPSSAGDGGNSTPIITISHLEARLCLLIRQVQNKLPTPHPLYMN